MTGRKSFGSDNHTGAHPAVIRAIVAANSGDAVAYGADQWTERVTTALAETFEAAGGAFLVLNGSGANVLGLSVLLRRHEAVICAASAHINTDECGAPERLVGTKLLTVPAPDGKLTPELIAGQLGGQGDEHFAQPGVVAVTQSTELGTCYTSCGRSPTSAGPATCGCWWTGPGWPTRQPTWTARWPNWRNARTCLPSAARRTARWARRRSS
jgi:threonine aldolase